MQRRREIEAQPRIMAPHAIQTLTRLEYIFTVYILTFILMLSALAQWESVAMNISFRKVFRDQFYIGIACFVSAIILLLLFILIRALRFILVINWLIALTIVECLIIAAANVIIYLKMLSLLCCFMGVLLLMITFLLIGSFIICDLTSNVAALFFIAVILQFLATFILMIHVCREANSFDYFYLYALLTNAIVLLSLMYHAQLISGARYAKILTNDGLATAIILFCHFILIFLLSCYIGQRFGAFSEIVAVETSVGSNNNLGCEKSFTKLTTQQTDLMHDHDISESTIEEHIEETEQDPQPTEVVSKRRPMKHKHHSSTQKTQKTIDATTQPENNEIRTEEYYIFHDKTSKEVETDSYEIESTEKDDEYESEIDEYKNEYEATTSNPEITEQTEPNDVETTKKKKGFGILWLGRQ